MIAFIGNGGGMGAVDRYIASVGSSNLMDDQTHHQTEPLAAAALAEIAAGGIGALLVRMKYANPTIKRSFEGDAAGLAKLLRLWTVAVTNKGRERGWLKANTAWDMQAAHALYRRVAEASLAYWLNNNCEPCGGTGSQGAQANYAACCECKGSGRAQMAGIGGLERLKIEEMVAELEDLVASHNRRAGSRLLRNDL